MSDQIIAEAEIKKNHVHKLGTGRSYQSVHPDFSLKRIAAATVENGLKTLALYESCTLDTAFQPVFSLAHKRIIGYEALLRVTGSDGSPISPATFFASLRNPEQTVFLDRLCRYIHSRNFARLGDDICWLFLNVAPYVAINGCEYGAFFNQMLADVGIIASQVVIELVEEPAADFMALGKSVQYYKDIGCLLAIDDFGAGHSNFERVWSMRPHIVKLEQGMITRADSQPRIRQMFSGIVDLLHQSGSLVLVEGIETESQAMIALEADVDFVQGYFFARPTTDLAAAVSASPDFDTLFLDFKKSHAINSSDIQAKYRKYRKSFCMAVNDCRNGKSFEAAASCLFEHKAVLRCYLLNASGIQIAPTIVSPRIAGSHDLRFRPLHDARSADWFRRHYLRRAVLHPEQLQITRPYMSITGEAMCVTLSVLFESEAGQAVLCCDLDFNSGDFKFYSGSHNTE